MHSIESHFAFLRPAFGLGSFGVDLSFLSGCRPHVGPFPHALHRKSDLHLVFTSSFGIGLVGLEVELSLLSEWRPHLSPYPHAQHRKSDLHLAFLFPAFDLGWCGSGTEPPQ